MLFIYGIIIYGIGLALDQERPTIRRRISIPRDNGGQARMARSNILVKCHCGDVELALPRKPAVITRCNCSYCRRIAPLFAYYKRRTIHFRSNSMHLESYIWGRGVLQWFRCKRCGSFTHHAPAGCRGPETRLGVNMRLVQPKVLLGTTVRLRDGSDDTWRVLKEYVL